MTHPLPKPSADDATILRRMRDGDVSALGALFDRYDQDVRRLIARLGVVAGDVDDLVQLTFLEAMRSAERFDGRASARGWLSGIAVMMVRRNRRSVGRLFRRLAAWATEPAEVAESAEARMELAQSSARARRALDRLSEKKRQVFVLVALEGHSGEEVAAMLAIPVATVWTRLHHARKELRETLAEES